MYDNSYNWEYLAKNFNSVSAELIANKALLRLGFYILAIGFLEKEAFCFTKIIGDNKKTNEEAKTVSNSKEK